MPHPALVPHVRGGFDDPHVNFDDSLVLFDSLFFSRIDQTVRRGVERPLVYYNEIVSSPDFDEMTIIFDSLLVPFDDGPRFLPNYSSRDSRDVRSRRPAIVVLG